MFTLPIWCQCGKIVTFSNETRCEDCYADAQQRFSGNEQSADIAFLSAKENEAHDRRAEEVKAYFQDGGHKCSGNRNLQKKLSPETSLASPATACQAPVSS